MPLPYDIGGCLSQTLLLLRRLSLYCLATREMAAVLFFCLAKQYGDMSNKNKRADRRNVSVEKLQEFLSKFIFEIAEGAKSLPVRKGNNGLVIYIENHGTLNLTFNEKGGKE